MSGSYHQIGLLARRRQLTEWWRVWFFGGLLLGAAGAAAARGQFAVGWAYGALGDLPPRWSWPRC